MKSCRLDNPELIRKLLELLSATRIAGVIGKKKYFSKLCNIFVKPADNHCLPQPKNWLAKRKRLRRQA